MSLKVANISDLLGLTITRISGLKNGSDLVVFSTSCGRTFQMFHYQDCCESVALEDTCGDVNDLLHSPILQAEESTNSDNPPEHADSFTWTFYRLATAKGQVVLRWLGESNGYYSERVEFEEQVGGAQ